MSGIPRTIYPHTYIHTYIHTLTPTYSYPDATVEELASANNVCIICREEMAERCKKLPCNHIFHVACLRSWFQRQQTCPTCRMDVLGTPTVAQIQPRRRNNQQPERQQDRQGESSFY